MLKLVRTTSSNQDFQDLIVLLDQVLVIADGDEHAFFAQYNKVDTINNVVVCYENKIAVGCGAFKKHNDETVEIKRMFVHPDYRGKGVASFILKELELWATELHYSESILETGIKLQNAIALYKKSGYAISENYGQYIGIENSVCMKKIIK